MKTLLITGAIIFLLAAPCFSAGKSVAELITIARAGAGLVLNMEERAYSVTELANIASNLKYQATLTIKMSRSKPLSAAQCAHIAKARPGQVIFWF